MIPNVLLCLVYSISESDEDGDSKTKRKRAKKEAKRDAKSNAKAQDAVGAEVRRCCEPLRLINDGTNTGCQQHTGGLLWLIMKWMLFSYGVQS